MEISKQRERLSRIMHGRFVTSDLDIEPQGHDLPSSGIDWIAQYAWADDDLCLSHYCKIKVAGVAHAELRDLILRLLNEHLDTARAIIAGAEKLE